jgi:two-component system LytT family response regulator
MNFPLSPLSVLIVDDEPAARRGVRLLLEDDPEIAIAGEAGNGAEALALIRRERPDLVFLDVQMADGNGFQVLEQLEANLRPTIVFVTAFDEFALQAFEVHAVDYLLKPYDDARFRAALDRAKQQVRHRQAEAVNARLTQLLDYLKQTPTAGSTAAGPDGSDRILIKSSGEIIFLKAGEIDWIEAEGDYMKFHVATAVPTSSARRWRGSRRGSTRSDSCASIARRSSISTVCGSSARRSWASMRSSCTTARS